MTRKKIIAKAEKVYPDKLKDKFQYGCLEALREGYCKGYKDSNKWREVAGIMYKGYKGMIGGIPWTDESVKEIDSAIKMYENLIKSENEI